MKNNLRDFLVLSLALFLFFGLVLFVFAWQNPTSAPPGGNVMELLNVGATPQVKTGALTISGDLTASSTLSVAATSSLAINGGSVGISTNDPSTKLDVYTESNTSGLRLRGVNSSSEISDIYVGTSGRLTFSNASTTAAAGYLDFYSKDDNYGYLFRESNNLSSTYLNLYVVENGTTDYANFVVANSISTLGLVIDSNENVGLGVAVPSYKLSLDGSVARTIGMERKTNGTAGTNLTVKAGGASAGTAALSGGNLYLDGGIATQGGASNVYIRVYGCYESTYGGECYGTADETVMNGLIVSSNGLTLYGSAAKIKPLYNVVDAANACDLASQGTVEGVCIDIGSNNESEFKLMATGNMTLQGTSSISGDPDYAEAIKVNDSKSIEPGDLLSASSQFVVHNDDAFGFDGVVAEKSSLSYDAKLIGIVSENPGYLIDPNGTMNHDGGRIREGYAPLALAGRVFTKVSSENGPIKIGDFITSGTMPGVGMKATKPGMTVGVALQNWSSNDQKEIGKILVLVSHSYFHPEYSFNNFDDPFIVYNPDSDEKALLKQGSSLVNLVGAFSELVVAHLKTGLLEAKKIVIGGVDILKKLEEQDREIRLLKQELELLKLNQ